MDSQGCLCWLTSQPSLPHWRLVEGSLMYDLEEDTTSWPCISIYWMRSTLRIRDNSEVRFLFPGYSAKCFPCASCYQGEGVNTITDIISMCLQDNESKNRELNNLPEVTQHVAELKVKSTFQSLVFPAVLSCLTEWSPRSTYIYEEA